MNRNYALMILQLPEDATRTQIDESYELLRTFYYPDFFGRPHEFTPNQIQENIRMRLNRGFYRPPKGVQYQNFPEDAYHRALFDYVLVCWAYDYLTDPENQHPFDADPRTPYGHDVRHYGKTVAFLRKKIPKITCALLIPVAIAWFICGLISVGNFTFFMIAKNVFWWIFVALNLANWITMPLDMLLLVPLKMWDGIVEGASVRPWIFKPIAACFMGVLYGIGGLFCLFLKPEEAVWRREDRYDPPIISQKTGRMMAQILYMNAMENLKAFRMKENKPYIDANHPSIQEVLKLAHQCYSTKKGLLLTMINYHDDNVKRTKRYMDTVDKMNKFGGFAASGPLDLMMDENNYEDAFDSWQHARAEREREVSKARSDFKMEEEIFFAYLYRAGVDPEDYLS